MKWVWLLWNDGPGNWVWAALILVDVELPVTIKIAREINGPEFYDSLRHLLGPAHAGAFHVIFDEVLAGAFDWATGDRTSLGKVFVVAHPGAVAVEVVGYRVQGFAFGAG